MPGKPQRIPGSSPAWKVGNYGSRSGQGFSRSSGSGGGLLRLAHLRGTSSRINGKREANPHLKPARPPATERGHPSPLYAGWSRFRCRRTLDSAHLANHVLAAVRVGDAERTLRIIPPITVHDEAVAMFPGRQRDRCRPDPILAFLHWDAALLPVTEITDQQNAHGSWCGETKCLL